MAYQFSQETLYDNLKFIAPVLDGVAIDIEFSENCFSEDYIEKGMRATLVFSKHEDTYENSDGTKDTIYEFRFDLTKFKEFNISIESPDYRDESGRFCLTASQVGEYPKNNMVTHFYSVSHEKLPFTILNSHSTDLYNLFHECGAKMSYISWLESIAIKIIAK